MVVDYVEEQGEQSEETYVTTLIGVITQEPYDITNTYLTNYSMVRDREMRTIRELLRFGQDDIFYYDLDVFDENQSVEPWNFKETIDSVEKE